MKTLIKWIVKIGLGVVLLILYYCLIGDDLLRLEGKQGFIEKIILCVIGYGIHRLVEWIANKKFPSDEENKKPLTDEILENQQSMLLKSLEKNQLLWYAEDAPEHTSYILTLDDKMFNLKWKMEDRLINGSTLLETSNKVADHIIVRLSLTTSDLEESFIAEVKRDLPQYEISKSGQIDTPAGEVHIKIWEKENKKQEEMVQFIYKVKDSLYFEGNFWTTKNSQLKADVIVKGIFQNVLHP